MKVPEAVELLLTADRDQDHSVRHGFNTIFTTFKTVLAGLVPEDERHPYHLSKGQKITEMAGAQTREVEERCKIGHIFEIFQYANCEFSE